MENATSLINHRTARRHVIATQARPSAPSTTTSPAKTAISSSGTTSRRNSRPSAPPSNSSTGSSPNASPPSPTRARPPRQLPCGADDTWGDHLHAYAVETKSLAEYLAP